MNTRSLAVLFCGSSVSFRNGILYYTILSKQAMEMTIASLVGNLLLRYERAVDTEETQQKNPSPLAMKKSIYR